ncbi:MAG: phosphopyruvate hydratase, partial [Francisellaceae bacterium]|nr:phosphopyruvate hydratase [Francisellaceae bacterium]
MKIKNLHAREIFDSRGWPTIEVEITLSSGKKGLGMVPSGASTGVKEALELRDGGTRFLGKGVLRAVENVNDKIAKLVVNMDFANQEELDIALIKLDGTENKANLGANAILAVSLAFAKACANNNEQELYHYLQEQYGSPDQNDCFLPMPMLNFINGGAHADNSVDIQEFMLVPTGATSLRAALQNSAVVFHTLKKILKDRKLQTAVGDEGGFAPDLDSNVDAIKLLCEAVELAGFKTGVDFFIALDVASSELYSDGEYHLKS